MQQITSVWSALDMRKRVIVVLASIAMFAAVMGVSRLTNSSQMTLLYAGLEPSAAGEVVSALEARGVAYDIRGGSIFVEVAQRDSLRMTLASEGLPANSGSGYELLDSLSGFGTTSQMFDAAYWRAKEGELARTIVASPAIKNARVHIGNVSTQRFRQTNLPSASVTVSTQAGALPPAQVKALKFLVASAVAGLMPDRVSVIDNRSGLLTSGDEAGEAMGNAADRADQLKQKVERLLEARVGMGNAVVELNLETVADQESIRERRFDPESRVAISTDTQETTSDAKDGDATGVTVASNLAEGDASSASSSSSSNNSESRERVNYEVSETTRELVKAPGAIKRLTVAVLVDGIREASGYGTETWSPRSEEELESLRDLVAGAVGLDETRGDEITIRTMEFEPVIEIGTAPEASLISSMNLDIMSLIKMGILSLVALVLGMFVLRPILASSTLVAGDRKALAPPRGIGRDGDASQNAVTEFDTSIYANGGGLPDLMDSGAPGGFEMPQLEVMTDQSMGGELSQDQDPVSKLRALIAERQGETVEILRGWMQDDEETVR